MQIQNSTGVLRPSSFLRSYLPQQYVGRVLLCSRKWKNPQYYSRLNPLLSGLLLYVAILSKVKRSDLSLHRSILSLTLNPSGVWAEMIEQSVPLPPKLPDPPPPSFLLPPPPSPLLLPLLPESVIPSLNQSMTQPSLFSRGAQLLLEALCGIIS